MLYLFYLFFLFFFFFFFFFFFVFPRPALPPGGGGGGSVSPLEFAKLNIADITGNEKISYFSYLCISTVIRQQNQSNLRLDPPPPRKNFLDPRLPVPIKFYKCM